MRVQVALFLLAVAVSAHAQPVSDVQSVPPSFAPADTTAQDVRVPRAALDAWYPLTAVFQGESFIARQENGRHVVGRIHELDEAMELRADRAPSGTEALSTVRVWRARVAVNRAARIRLRFAGEGMIWAAGPDDEDFIPFQVGAGSQWGPITKGEWVDVYAESNAGVRVSAYAEVAEARIAAEDTACLVSASCFTEQHFPGIGFVRAATAQIIYATGNSLSQCTGALMADVGSTFTPYFLTANHCVSTQAEAASIQATWDYYPAACGGQLGNPPVTFGAQLLSTSESTDVTLLLMSSIPSGRAFLGWNINPGATPHGTALYRVSHPEGLSQAYSQSFVNTSDQTCDTLPRPNFIYADPSTGQTSGGSSGAPVSISGGYVVGQLLGRCGISFSNCSVLNDQVDGALAISWPILQPFLGCNGSVQVAANGCISRYNCLTGQRMSACP